MPDSNPDWCKRRFLKTVSVTGLCAALPGIHPMPLLAGQGATPQTAFASSFKNVPPSYGPTEVKFNRPLPDGLQGTLYRNGPALMQRGHTQYQHWFDGDGMIHAFNIFRDKLVHHGKMIHTDRYLEEQAAGRFLRGGFGTGFTDSLAVTHPDDINVGNISVLPLDDEILALWEAGSAWRINPQTLTTLGRKTFSKETDRLPFSAHPRYDPAGHIWNFGYMSGSGKLILYHLSTSGKLHRTGVIDAPNADMVHDFAITEHHLIFVLTPVSFQPGSDPAAAFADHLRWNENGTTHIVVIDKNNLQVTHRFELPSFFLFHLGNAWEDQKTIQIEVATAPDFNLLMEQISQATLGLPMGTAPAQPAAIQIELDTATSRAGMKPLPTTGIDFPRFDQRFTGLPTQQLFMLGRSPGMSEQIFGFNRVIAMDRTSESENHYTYNDNTLAEEHIFVPEPETRQGQGWLIGTGYDWHKGVTTVSVFNAQQIQDGPVAMATLPYSLPLGLHGQFVSL